MVVGSIVGPELTVRLRPFPPTTPHGPGRFLLRTMKKINPRHCQSASASVDDERGFRKRNLEVRDERGRCADGRRKLLIPRAANPHSYGPLNTHGLRTVEDTVRRPRFRSMAGRIRPPVHVERSFPQVLKRRR